MLYPFLHWSVIVYTSLHLQAVPALVAELTILRTRGRFPSEIASDKSVCGETEAILNTISPTNAPRAFSVIVAERPFLGSEVDDREVFRLFFGVEFLRSHKICGGLKDLWRCDETTFSRVRSFNFARRKSASFSARVGPSRNTGVVSGGSALASTSTRSVRGGIIF